MLLVANGLTTRNKKLLVTSASLLGARTLRGAPGLTTRNKKLLEESAHVNRRKKRIHAHVQNRGCVSMVHLETRARFHVKSSRTN